MNHAWRIASTSSGPWPFFGQKVAHRRSDRVHEGDHVPQRDVGDRPSVVGLVLLRPGVAESDLLLVVEPGAVVGAAAGVEDPLTEPRPHPGEVVVERLPSGVEK